MQLMEEQMKYLEELIISGLAVSGAHHKQWYLEKIAEALGIDMRKTLLRRHIDEYVEKGIEP